MPFSTDPFLFPEKEIAESLGLTRATTHKYVTDIFRSFDVTSRTGLVTLWMGGS